MPPPAMPRPERPAYSTGQELEAGQNTTNMRLLNVDHCGRIQIRKPSWKGKETIIRPYPCLAYQGTQGDFEPYRLDPGGANTMSDWIRRYECAWQLGSPPVTFLLRSPGRAGPHFDPWSTPLGVLYRAIEGAVRANTAPMAWRNLIDPPAGPILLPKPRSLYLLQGCLVKIDDQFTFSSQPKKNPLGWPPNPPLILVLSQKTGRDLINMLAEENPGYRGDPADFEARFRYGDPVSPDQGRYFHFIESGHEKDTASAQGPVDPYSGTGVTGITSAAANNDFAKGYAISITHDGRRGMPVKMNNEVQLAALKQQWRFWDKILWFPTEKEQVEILFEKLPAEVLFYAFEREHAEWIPESARKGVTNVPATPPGQDHPGHPGQPAAVPVNPFGDAGPGPGAPWMSPAPAAAPSTAPAAGPVAGVSPFGGADAALPAAAPPVDPLGGVPVGTDFFSPAPGSAGAHGATPPASPTPPTPSSAPAADAAGRTAAQLAQLAMARARSQAARPS